MLELRELWREQIRSRQNSELSKVAKPRLTGAERAVRQKAWNAERTRRINDLRSLPVVPLDPEAVSVTQLTDADPEQAKIELNKSFLKAWLVANLPLAAVDQMWEWLRDHLVSGGLLAQRTWLAKNYAPLVAQEQQSRIINALQADKEAGLTVMIDGSTDFAHDQKPFNIMVATSSAIYYCTTEFCDPTISESHDTIIPLVREFARIWLPGDLPDYVYWFSTDNDNKMGLVYKKLSDVGGLFHQSAWIPCLAHGAARIGACIKDKKCVAPVITLCSQLSSLLKGKIFVQRRWALRQGLIAAGRDPTNLPDKWGGTRWECWYVCVVFIAKNLGFLQTWIKGLKMQSESQAWPASRKSINDRGPQIKVQSLFIMHAFEQLYDSLGKVFQLSPVVRGGRVSATRTPNHVLYNKIDAMYVALLKLSTITSVDTLHDDVKNAMAKGHVTFDTMKPIFQEIAGHAAKTALKYRDNASGQLAKAMRIFDPHQRHNWTVDSLEDFVQVIPYKLHPHITDTVEGSLSEWQAYFAVPAPPEKSDLLKWWKSVSSAMPHLAKQADRMLRILITTVQVEGSFSTYNSTRDERQWSMDSETHLCRISFSFNGVVPPGKDVIAPMAHDCSTRRPPLHIKNACFPLLDDVVEGAVSQPATKAAVSAQQSTSASAEHLDKVSRRTKKAKKQDAEASQAGRSDRAVIPAVGASRQEKTRSQVDRSQVAEIPMIRDVQASHAVPRGDCPERDVIPAATRKREREGSPSDKSQAGTVTAVNADDPDQQLENYDVFVAE